MISRDANGLADRGNNRRRAYHKAGPVGQDNIPAKAGIWIHIFTGMTQGVFGGLFAYQSSPTFRGRGYEDFKGISRFVNIGIDLWTLDLDAPGVLPSVIPVINTHKSRQQLAIDLIRREQPTVRQLLRKMVAGGRRILFGSAQDIVDNFEHWFRAGAADGFNIMFPDLHGSVDRFVEQVVPELQRRGLFRTSHEGRTLRDNLGLARPENRFSVRSARGSPPPQHARLMSAHAIHPGNFEHSWALDMEMLVEDGEIGQKGLRGRWNGPRRRSEQRTNRQQ